MLAAYMALWERWQPPLSFVTFPFTTKGSIMGSIMGSGFIIECIIFYTLLIDKLLYGRKLFSNLMADNVWQKNQIEKNLD